MKLSLQWLKDYLPGLRISAEQVAKALTGIGLEVESILHQKKLFPNIIVGEVLGIRPHPQATRLQLCRVNTGEGELELVCGANNVAVGHKYPLALVGALLPNVMEIKSAQIRGVISNGMLCSAKELGLADDSSGLLELSLQAKPGQSLSSALNLTDSILDIAITPNRGDCLSHRGIARDLSAVLNIPIQEKKLKLVQTEKLDSILKVLVKDKPGCPRYCGRIISGVAIKPSPEWLRQRLLAVGIRPINNIVDATNFIMMDLGHPVHAFDSRFIEGSQIQVRRAGEKIIFETIDHEKRELEPDDLVIADKTKPIALAGIMGGVHSEIREGTQEIVLEVASFSASRIRRTAKRLGISTESSARFERYVPRESIKQAMTALTQLVVELAGGRAGEIVDHYTNKYQVRTVSLTQSKLSALLGITIPASRVKTILSKLGLNPKKTKSGWVTRIPDHRPDLAREVDLIEEVIRIYGLDNIPSSLPQRCLRTPTVTALEVKSGLIKNYLVGRGFSETIHYSFLDPQLLEKCRWPQTACLSLTNALSQELSILRPSLFPHLIQNIKRDSSCIRLFELRTVFSSKQAEKKMLGVLLKGVTGPRHWQVPNASASFYDLKGVFEGLLSQMRAPVLMRAGPAGLIWHPAQAMTMELAGQPLGGFGAIHPELAKNFQIEGAVFYGELDYGFLVTHCGEIGQIFQSLSPFPKVVRDLALIADSGLSYEALFQTIKSAQIPWLQGIELFDVYQGERVPEGKKSLALSLTYENPARTLTDEEVNQAHFALVATLSNKLGVHLRA